MSGRGLLAAAAGAVLALSIAPGAGAQNAPSADLALTAPAPDTVFGGPQTASGSAHAKGGVSPTILWIKADLVWGKPGAPPPMPKPVNICGVAPGAEGPPGPCQGQGTPDVTFNNAPVPQAIVNGPYQLVVTVHVQDGLNQNAEKSVDVKYGVAVPPATVTNLKSSVKNRVVTLGWDRNSEVDVAYDVYRQVPGEKPPSEALVRVVQEDGDRVTFIDDKAPAKGGDYLYGVLAVRPGATGDFATSHVNAPKPALVKATLPPGTPGATTPPTQPKGPGGSPPVIKGTSGNTPRLSSATANTSSAPSTSIPVTPDPGFVRDLPYGGSTIPGGSDDGSGEDNNVAIQQSGGRGKSNTRGILIPAATGAILFVAAFQLRWLKNRLDEPPTPLT